MVENIGLAILLTCLFSLAIVASLALAARLEDRRQQIKRDLQNESMKRVVEEQLLRQPR